MPDELTAFDFSIEDVIGGQPMTPDTVDLPTLRGFLEEVETLVKGDVPGVSLADSRIRIEKGSLKVVVFVTQMLAANIQSDLRKLEHAGDLDLIQPKRAEVIERWQSRARRSPNRTYSILSKQLAQAICITHATQFQHGGENAWVSVEKYLVGKVVDLGGKQNPNVHLILADTGASVRVGATEQQLASEKENQLYREVTLRVQGEQHLRTKELRNLRLIQFARQSAEVDEQALAALWEKGREAWTDVKSASKWVEELRGN